MTVAKRGEFKSPKFKEPSLPTPCHLACQAKFSPAVRGAACLKLDWGVDFFVKKDLNRD